MDGPEKLPVRWLAPEASAKWKFSHASDIWAFGITIWEICSVGERPFRELHNREVQKHVKSGKRLQKNALTCTDFNDPEIRAESFYSKIYNIMCQTWSIEPTKRPSSANIKLKIAKYFNMFL